ncbi:MAG: DUF2470 domain-containing protein [Candidatus Rokubacteria bacterium]|nr:DUF2470 domain-containing protein [Candidatus Rokubacteria bacterium]
MNRHAGPGEPQTPPPPEPTYAERARTLVSLGRTGTLSTLSRKHPGAPFGSVMPYVPDERGGPLFLISSMAMHTQNLAADPRTSLLVVQPGWEDDPLGGGRVTLMGAAARLAEDERASARAAYLARHPKAQHWVDFQDFAFWRLRVEDVYFVGGFGAMDWVGAGEYGDARPDPLADVAAGIIEHMNRDHAAALRVLAHARAGAPVDEAWMVAVDRLGLRLRLRTDARVHSARIAFPREVRTAEECRAVLVEMLAAARAPLAP